MSRKLKIYLLTAIELTAGGSSAVQVTHKQYSASYTQTVQCKLHRTTQLILEECGPCSVFASYTLEFALQLREKQGKLPFSVS